VSYSVLHQNCSVSKSGSIIRWSSGGKSHIARVRLHMPEGYIQLSDKRPYITVSSELSIMSYRSTP